VVGPRRIGKTSFLLYISHPAILQEHGIDPEKTLFVYIDCQGLSPLEREEIYRSMLAAISDKLSAVGIDIASRFRDERMTYALFERTLKEISRRGIRIVLLLDEFEAMSCNPNLGEEFFSGLRALPGKCELAYVTASCISLDELHRAHHSLLSSSFFNTFYPLRLGLFSRDDSRYLLRESLRRVGARFSSQVLELVLETGGDHPFFLQIAGYWAFGPPMIGAKPTEAEQKSYLRGVKSEVVGHLNYYWQKLIDRERYALAALPFSSEDVGYQKSIDYLKDQCLIVQRDGTWDYFSPLLEDFVRQQEVNGLLQTGHLLIDQRQGQVFLRGVPVSLSPKNYALLVCLVKRAGQVVNSEELWQAVWPEEHYIDDERLKSCIKNLRKTLGNDVVVNKRGVGYCVREVSSESRISLSKG